jgi:hypothetical protein
MRLCDPYHTKELLFQYPLHNPLPDSILSVGEKINQAIVFFMLSAITSRLKEIHDPAILEMTYTAARALSSWPENQKNYC